MLVINYAGDNEGRRTGMMTKIWVWPFRVSVGCALDGQWRYWNKDAQTRPLFLLQAHKWAKYLFAFVFKIPVPSSMTANTAYFGNGRTGSALVFFICLANKAFFAWCTRCLHILLNVGLGIIINGIIINGIVINGIVFNDRGSPAAEILKWLFALESGTAFHTTFLFGQSSPW